MAPSNCSTKLADIASISSQDQPNSLLRQLNRSPQMRIEPFRKYHKDRVADISAFSLEIFKFKYFYKAPTWHFEWARAQPQTLARLKY
jgi:hypothetical protein